MNKELILFISLVLIIAFSVIYWVWFSNNEYKRLIAKIKNMPLVIAIIAIFSNDDTNNNNGATT
jgi:putative copper export protein